MNWNTPKVKKKKGGFSFEKVEGDGVDVLSIPLWCSLMSVELVLWVEEASSIGKADEIKTAEPLEDMFSAFPVLLWIDSRDLQGHDLCLWVMASQ